jgi:LmbE family N-acetylglucosaminyl deacetylase
MRQIVLKTKKKRETLPGSGEIMLGVDFSIKQDSALQVLCLGAHSDDIEIGCGGTILRLLQDFPDVTFKWIVFGSEGQRTAEAQQSAAQFLGTAKDKEIIVRNFRDGFFPYLGGEIKEYFEQLKQKFSPDLIFTHYRNDLHQDHRLICELTWNTFRNHMILEYEIPKYDGDLGLPNFFVHLNEEVCKQKIEYILAHYKSQQDRQWFTEDTFLSLLRLRGIESRSPSKYAEAFYGRKLVL